MRVYMRVSIRINAYLIYDDPQIPEVNQMSPYSSQPDLSCYRQPALEEEKTPSILQENADFHANPKSRSANHHHEVHMHQGPPINIASRNIDDF